MPQESPIIRRFHDRLAETWERDGLAPARSLVLVGVSGGADSMALLDALTALRGRLSFTLAVAHLNHCLRGEASDADAEFVVKEAEQRGLVVYCDSVDVAAAAEATGQSTESSARVARREYLERIAAETGAARIAVGHHRDDVAETVLMRLLRGTGSGGLAAMAPTHDDLWIRPFLEFTGQEVRDYLDARGASHVEDASNASREHLRNRVRHDLLPLLERDYNPRARRALAATSAVLRDESALLDEMATDALGQAVGVDGVESAAIAELPVAIARRVVRLWLTPSAVARSLSFEETERVRRFVTSDSRATVWVTRRVALERRGSHVAVVDPQDISTASLSRAAVAVPTPGTAELPDAGVSVRTKFHAQRRFTRGPLESTQAAYDAAALPGPLSLRRWRPGDRFQPFGLEGSKTVSDFVSDARLPADERRHVTVLCAGDEVIWVVGLRADGRYAVTGGTIRILIVDAEMSPA
jgi:tRNA(Ile)-lysidine synthase